MSTIPYVPAYLRATPPTLWPVTSPLDFGAIGNGSTDDYPAIAAALHALSAKGGGTLVFPSDRDFRIATPGVHGIHLDGQSNITIMMGERSRLIMDNLVDGVAVSHGIYVQGPCANITLIGVHVKYAAMSRYRQTWAPVYFLGANVGTGDEGTGGWYRGTPGGENADLIAAGAIRDVYLENVTCEDSPSVGIGLVGVDGVVARNVTLRQTWADGIYLRYFRRARIDGYYGLDVADDGISLGTEDSDLDAADIELPFHGEYSVVTNVVLEGQYRAPGDGYRPAAGGIVPLGVRDVTVSDVVITDRFRAIRFEPGPQKTLDYPLLNLNFLANRRVIIKNVAISRCVQDIACYAKEVNYRTDPKWWMQDVLIEGVIGENGSSYFDFNSAGVPQNGGPPQPTAAGITFKNLKFTNYINPSATFSGAVHCTIDGLETDSFISFQGPVPYLADPDQLDGDGNPMWRDCYCTFRNIRGQTVVFQGLKRALIENFQSINAPTSACIVSSCADVTLRGVRIVFPNRLNDPVDNSGIHIDAFCKRITGTDFEVEQDANYVHALVLRSVAGHWISNVRVRTAQNLDNDPQVALVSDRGWIETKVSQIGQVEWCHTGGTRGWGRREFPRLPAPEVHGDADTNIFVPNRSHYHRLVFPLSESRTWVLQDGVAAIGDRLEVTRDVSSSGDFPVVFEGNTEAVGAFPVSDARTTVFVAGGPGGQLTGLLVNDTVQLLGAPVGWASSNVNTAALIAAAINDYTGTSGFTASTSVGTNLVVIYAPAGSLTEYNYATVDQTTAGDMILSIGVIPRMGGGADETVAGETSATTNFFLTGDLPGGFSGTIASITVNGIELLAGPVEWEMNSNRTAYLVAEAARANYEAHGFPVSSSYNNVFIQAPPGYGASANGWEVVVTPTGDVTTYDVKPMSGGADRPIPSSSETYEIATTKPGAPFHAVFEFTGPRNGLDLGWRLVSLDYPEPFYPNGKPLHDAANRLLNFNGNAVVDEFKNIKYANGAVLGWDSGRLGISSVPPASSGASGVAGMVTWDAGYLYVCTATDTWKRIALSAF